MNHGLARIVALTGGIGSGKSTFAAAFAVLGVPFLDTDLVARRIHQDPTHPATAAIAHAFPAAMTPDGRLARGSLRAIFALDSAANDKLKDILRPWALAEAQRWRGGQRAPYVIWESALMMDQDVGASRVLVIDAPEHVRISRIKARNPDWSDEQVTSILSMQPERDAYLGAADDVAINQGSLDDIANTVAQLHATYLTLWSQP